MNNYDLQLLKKYVEESQIPSAIKKLEKGYPVQYIIGNVEFYNCLIKVNENVLIPRFETEYLVDKLIKLIKQKGFNKLDIIDLCTGSGCIAIALKKHLDCNMTALDISSKAIEVAKTNSKENNTFINFICSDVKKFNSEKKYDIIISNPPYVKKNECVDPKTKYEPQIALFAEDEGLEYYKIILDKSQNIINKKSIIAFEIGDKQATEIKKYALNIYPKANIIVEKDLNDYERYVFIINE